MGESNTPAPIIQDQHEIEENRDGNEVSLHRESRNRHPTLLTLQKRKTCKNPSRITKQLIHHEQKTEEKLCKQEYDSLIDSNTWTLVDEPEDKKGLPGKWVYKVKYGANGQVDKLKARYLAKGFAQIEGLDFFDIYAPTCKPETFRILLATAAQKDLQLGQMDVKSAYLHSNIEEEIYLEQPEGFVKKANSDKS